jgi:hypothetical protein
LNAPDTQACGTPAVVRPSRLVVAVVRQAFGPAERAMFRVLGIRQYLLLRRAAS